MDQAVSEIAQPGVQVEPEHTLVRAVIRMERAGARQLAVIDGKDGNRLIGLLTMSDIVRAHAHAALEAGDPDKSAAPESSPRSSNP